MMPPMMARPMGAWISPPSLKARASGSMPKTMAMVVMMMGRMRMRPAWSSASATLAPALRAWLAKSTSRMAFLVTSPISITRPIMLKMLSVLRHSSRASITPISANGRLAMMAMGCRKLPNWLASTM